MRRYIIISLLLALVLTPVTLDARKKKDKKYDKRTVSVESVAPEQPMREITVTDAPTQLYGEWDMTTIRKKTVLTMDRAYLYLDFAGGNKVYGNTGCNTLNGKFTLQDKEITFHDLTTTGRDCRNITSERTIIKALTEVKAYSLMTQYNAQYLHLLDGKGRVVMVLKRHNLDALNGAWLVKEINSTNVSHHQARVVIDADLQTIHGNTGCNIINGVITLDPSKDMAIQFEDLHSTEHRCDDIHIETALLLALEQTVMCKRVNSNEMALLDKRGSIVVVLQRIDLR